MKNSSRYDILVLSDSMISDEGAGAEFADNRIMFPSEEKLSRCEVFLYDSPATQKYNNI